MDGVFLQIRIHLHSENYSQAEARNHQTNPLRGSDI
jgi:hypothetical protein